MIKQTYTNVINKHLSTDVQNYLRKPELILLPYTSAFLIWTYIFPDRIQESLRNDKGSPMTAKDQKEAYRYILPYLRQIEHLILDEEISEIMVNSSDQIFIERKGVMSKVPDVRLPPEQLRVAVQNIARSLGDDISEQKPILDCRLPDGSRIAAVLPPCSINGIT
ncbi:MAG TPA: ATPase, T2SS/T4P/T4SS family, partial [Candidatus Angelobacter sp.]|nr:ATPase, T2SS/T4P/T4SS family [Candidatus Angelobacter sp.]